MIICSVTFFAMAHIPRLCLPPVPLIMVLGHTFIQSVGEKNRFLAGPRLLHPAASVLGGAGGLYNGRTFQPRKFSYDALQHI